MDELLRVYLQFDLLPEACDLLVTYLEAVSGKGKEEFALKVMTMPMEIIVFFIIFFQIVFLYTTVGT